jgi:hypothetical protein
MSLLPQGLQATHAGERPQGSSVIKVIKAAGNIIYTELDINMLPSIAVPFGALKTERIDDEVFVFNTNFPRPWCERARSSVVDMHGWQLGR